MAVTMESAIFMVKNFQNNHNSIVNTEDLTLKQMFDISAKLVSEQDEISGLETIGWAVEVLSSTKFSLNSCSQSGKSCNRSLCTSSRPSFLFVCLVSVGLCIGFPRSSSLVHLLLSGTGFSAHRLTSNTESGDEDAEEVGVGVVEELVDKPETTNGT